MAELPDAASLHTQLLVYRQEWSELQQDLLAQVNQPSAKQWDADMKARGLPCLHQHNLSLMQAAQGVHIMRLLPPPCSLQQQRSELMAAEQSLDSAYHTARADLLAEWPTALESPLLRDELPKLQSKTCYSHY